MIIWRAHAYECGVPGVSDHSSTVRAPRTSLVSEREERVARGAPTGITTKTWAPAHRLITCSQHIHTQ